MLRIFNNKAQATSSEYVLVFFLVLGMVAAMSVYFRRTIQGRIRDANFNVVSTVANRVGHLYNGNLARIYEPYYLNQASDTVRFSIVTDTLRGSTLGTSGIYNKILNESTRTRGVSVTKPPKDRD